MPGSAPPRMPHATPPKAAGTIGVVNRMLSTLEKRRPESGWLRNAEDHDEQQPERNRARHRDDDTAPVAAAALVVGGGDHQGSEGDGVADPRDDRHVDRANPQQTRHAPDMFTGKGVGRLLCPNLTATKRPEDEKNRQPGE